MTFKIHFQHMQYWKSGVELHKVSVTKKRKKILRSQNHHSPDYQRWYAASPVNAAKKDTLCLVSRTKDSHRIFNTFRSERHRSQ